MRRPAARNMMMPIDSILPALIAQSGTGKDVQERVEREAKIGAAPASGQVQEKGGGTLVDSFKAAIPEALGRCLVDLAMKMHDVFSH